MSHGVTWNVQNIQRTIAEIVMRLDLTNFKPPNGTSITSRLLESASWNGESYFDGQPGTKLSLKSGPTSNLEDFGSCEGAPQ